MKKSWMAALLFVLAAPALSAEETLKAYAGTEEPIARELFDAFERETGIKVEWTRLSGGEAVARIEAERQSPQAGIWVGGVGTMHIDLKNKGLTAPYSSLAAADAIPAKYRDRNKYWVGLYVGPLSFCYNAKLMKELDIPVPAGWADLANPVYAKRIRMAHPSTSGTAYNVITTVIRIHGGDEDKAFEYLKRLNGSIDRYDKSGAAPGKSCAAGEIPISIGYRHDQLRLRDLGAPIEIVMPAEGSGYETASMSLLKDGPNQAEARRLYNWMLGDGAKEIFLKWNIIPLVESLDPQGIFQNLKLVDQDDEWDAANKERLIARWNREITAEYE